MYIIKWKTIWGSLYLLAYELYFGTNIVNKIQVLLSAVKEIVDINLYKYLLLSLIWVIFPILTMLYLLMDKTIKNNPKHKKQTNVNLNFLQIIF